MTPHEIATAFQKWAQANHPGAALVLVVAVDGDASCISNLPPPIMVVALEQALVQARQMVAAMEADEGPPS